MDTHCLPTSEQSLELAAKLLSAGETVALPTETVYGLAADATNDAAIASIYRAKGRPSSNPLIVHVDAVCVSVEALAARGYIDLEACSEALIQTAEKLMERFWPGPLTLIFPRGDRIASNVTAGGQTVGLRMPRCQTFQALLERLDYPLAAPSANRSNRISPTRAEDVVAELTGRIPLVLDAGPCGVGVESSVVYLEMDGGIRLLRPGGISLEHLELVLETAVGQATEADPVHSPGMGSVHYAPDCPLILSRLDHDWRSQWPADAALPKDIAVLLFSGGGSPAEWIEGYPEGSVKLHRLSDAGDGELAARQLYATLRELDAASPGALIVEYPTHSSGLWDAIRDRLTRASRRR